LAIAQALAMPFSKNSPLDDWVAPPWKLVRALCGLVVSTPAGCSQQLLE